MAWAMEHYKARWEEILNGSILKKENGVNNWHFQINDPKSYGSGDCVRLICRKTMGKKLRDGEESLYPVFAAYFQQYPFCCAFDQMNGFDYSSSIEAEIPNLLKHYIKTMRENYRSQFAKQLM